MTRGPVGVGRENTVARCRAPVLSAALAFVPPLHGSKFSHHLLQQQSIGMMAKGFGAPKPAPKKEKTKAKARPKKLAVPKTAAVKQAAKPNGVTDAAGTDGVARRVDVDLGRDKSVAVMLPVLANDPDDAAVESMTRESLVEQFGHLTGAGDIVWPAGLAFSRLLAHCPSFVAEQRVVEVGSGLGAVGLTAALSGAASVVLTDYDEDVLALATLGAQENGVPQRVSTAPLDWSPANVALPPGAPFDVVLGADVLYDQQNALNIARLLPKLLREGEGAKALIADQKQWPWRELFEGACAKVGLSVAQTPIPGPDEILLLVVSRDE